MKTSHRSLAACTVVLALALAACSDDSGDSGDSSAASDAPAAASTVASDATEPASDATEPASDATEPATDPAGSGGSFSVSISEPSALDPALAQEVEGAQVVRLLFTTLTTLTPELELVPGVATEWSVADDGVTWTFELDPAATFSDGTTVDAGDFVYAIARTADPDLAAPAAYQGYPITGWADVLEAEASGAVGDVPVAGVTAVDDDTLQIVTDEPFSLLPMLLTYPVFAPVPSELADDPAAAEAFAEQPIGNGPYVMAEPWQHNESITVVRNDSFAGPAGVADEIEFRIYSDLLTAYRDYQAGSLDIVRGLPPEEFQAAKDTYGELFFQTPLAALNYIGLPVGRAPFDNVDFRMALSLSIDREALVDRVLQGAVESAGSYVPPQVPGASDTACEACVYDLELAQEHFAASGVEPGTTIVLYDIADDGQAVIEFLTNTWADAFGLEIEVRSFEFAQFLEETAADKVEGPFELGWVWDYPSGYSMLQPLFASGSGANNLSYASEEFDALMTQIETSTDPAEVPGLLNEAEQVVLADLPMLPLSFGRETTVHAERISGLQVDAGALYRLELVTVTG
jgi:oligopeptide transport system substrate-binding protein